MARSKRIFRSAQGARRSRFPVGTALVLVLLLSGAGFALLGSGVLHGLDPTRLVALPWGSKATPEPELRHDAASTDVHVVDGETLLLGAQVVRLEGIQAPARGESCTDASGRSFDCGEAAAAKLASLVANHGVDCDLHGRDAFSRPLGSCRSADSEVNARLVAEGWALADGEAFSASEGQARSRGLGLWASDVVPPADWRERR